MSISLNSFNTCKLFEKDKEWIPITKTNSNNLYFKRNIKIAVLDSGIDKNNTFLRKLTLSGYNFVDNNDDVTDILGHGTEVAGVLALMESTLFKSMEPFKKYISILPVKIVDTRGYTDELKICAGVKYAIENHADIILLSLGQQKDSEEMRRVFEVSEAKGVVVIAAAGNSGNEIEYPAAYPTVVSVGSIKRNKEVEDYSNKGNEIDFVSLGTLQTFQTGGQIAEVSGTSIAAPQVAMIAAAVLSSSTIPLKPYKVREILRQNTEDVDQKGFDFSSGYGFLRTDRLFIPSSPSFFDTYEGNNKEQNSSFIPIGKLITANLSDSQDKDWYSFEVPYDGTVCIKPKSIDNSQSKVDYKVKYKNQLKPQCFNVEKGRNSIAIESKLKNEHRTADYEFIVQFFMHNDQFEENDRITKAKKIDIQPDCAIVGNFNRKYDEDWFVFQVTVNKRLVININSSSSRMETELRLFSSNQLTSPQLLVNDSDKKNINSINLEAGTYMLQINNHSGLPVEGEYLILLSLSD
ncbi:S8 family serine peptidase [Paenibacillus sp. sgz500958]|uniref:S8 family peptidase n=1 Tax=Paenibacillus sp. sgz500958 TaxID=3242475 RepID=UPI0036D3A7B3